MTIRRLRAAGAATAGTTIETSGEIIGNRRMEVARSGRTRLSPGRSPGLALPRVEIGTRVKAWATAGLPLERQTHSSRTGTIFRKLEVSTLNLTGTTAAAVASMPTLVAGGPMRLRGQVPGRATERAIGIGATATGPTGGAVTGFGL
jgi:hypothetical protein